MDNPRLDFAYTVFGQVDTMSALDTIAEGETIVSITFKKQTTEGKDTGLRSAGLHHIPSHGRP